MQFEQVFSSAIEVGIATAGFSGIVVILGQRGEGVWNRADLARVSILLQASFVAIALSFLPLVLDGAGVPESTIWRIGSACFVVYAGVAIPIRRSLARRIQVAEPSFSPALINAILPVSLLVAALQIYNVAVLGAGWPFVITVIYELALALVAFVRLLQTLWRSSDA